VGEEGWTGHQGKNVRFGEEGEIGEDQNAQRINRTRKPDFERVGG